MTTPKLQHAKARHFLDEIEKALGEGHFPPSHPGINGRDKRSAIRVAGLRLGMKAGSIQSTFLAATRATGRAPDWSRWTKDVGFQAAKPPEPDEPIDELLDQRCMAFQRKDKAASARKLIEVRVKLDGPIGICHFGDPHVDDDGCDLPALRRHIAIVNSTPGLFGANVGDLQNNWVGRLSHLWGEQETSKRQAWRLTEWLVRSVPWLYLVGGNHDAWSGQGDPLQWMIRDQAGVFDYDGVRIALRFPNGKEIRVNCRHDFAGHSMWNPVHGPLKAAMMGWRDHILSCGHKHTSGAMPVKDPMSGLITNVIRCAGFKKHDNYAKKAGFPDGTISPAITTIIDPTKDDNDPDQVTVIHGIERAAFILNAMRQGGRRRAA